MKVIKISFDFGYVQLYDTYAVGVMNEGADISADDHILLSSALQKHFGRKPFGYISNRLYSYSIDPRAYQTTSKIKNLIAISVVTNNPAQRLSASVEELFFGRPFQYFGNISEARHWMLKTVNPEATPQSA